MRQGSRPAIWEHGYIVPRDPGTIAIASLAMTAIGTGASMIGQMQQGQAQAGMANYQSQVARNNQQIAEWNANRALQQGQVAEDQSREKTAQIKGAQRAALAGQGGDVNSGSPLDIVSDTSRAGEFDAQTIRSNAALQAYGYRIQGAGYGGTANAYGAAGANATANLPFGIGSSLLGGLSSGAGKWYDYMRNNPGNGIPSGMDAQGNPALVS